MKMRNLVTVILALALAAANTAPLSAMVTCTRTDGPADGGCACDAGACCPAESPDPGETPAGSALNALCCLVTLPDAAPVETAPAPSSTSVEDAAPVPAIVPMPDASVTDSQSAPALAADPPPEESPPRYALHCAYLI